MKERPILFSGEMVRAILAGQKTMTRRVVRFNDSHRIQLHGKQWHIEDTDVVNRCPFGIPGDRLWVRETFVLTQFDKPVYKADSTDKDGYFWSSIAADPKGVKWRPSIFMPRWASRITLEITNVRVERLDEITDDDAIKEGVERVGKTRDGFSPLYKNYFVDCPDRSAKYSFSTLWRKINGKKYPWESNPWVWVIEFKKISPAGE